MRASLVSIFKAFKKGLNEDHDLFKQFQFKFLGTSYAPAGKSIKTVKPVAEKMGVGAYVTEQTDRLGYFRSIGKLQGADGVIVPGSDDAGYTASKIYNYMLCGRPMYCVFHSGSSVNNIVKNCKAGYSVTLQDDDDIKYSMFKKFLEDCLDENWKSSLDLEEFSSFTAEYLTKKQTDFFTRVLKPQNSISNVH